MLATVWVLVGLVHVLRGRRRAAIGLGVALSALFHANYLVFVATVAIPFAALPGVHEVPNGFPAELLWQFRVGSLATQLVLWSALAALFGLACERAALSQAAPASESRRDG